MSCDAARILAGNGLETWKEAPAGPRMVLLHQLLPDRSAMNDAEPDFTAAELYDLLRVHARNKCAVCGVELQAHFGIAKRPDCHFFFGKIEDLEGGK